MALSVAQSAEKEILLKGVQEFGSSGVQELDAKELGGSRGERAE
jgi:hypothetical protein